MGQTVFNNEMVAHVWAQKNQPFGRNANDSFSFSGRELISYNTSIGYLFEGFALLSNDPMSNTTGRHISYGSRAVSYRDIRIDNIFEWGKRYSHYAPKGTDIKKALLDMVLELAKSYDKRRTDSTRQRDAHQIGQILADLLQVCNYFGLKYPKGYDNVADALGQTAATVAKLARVRIAKEKKRQKEQKEKRRISTEDFEKWLSGAGNYCPYVYQTTQQAKLTVYKEVVYTTGGAEAPLDHVRKAFKIYNRIVKSGKAWEKNGERARLGHFELDRIDENGNAWAGCHSFSAQELKRFSDKWLN